MDGSGCVLPTPTTIKDRPRFPYRGLMIDPARHYLTPAFISKVVRAMSFSKLNVVGTTAAACLPCWCQS